MPDPTPHEPTDDKRRTVEAMSAYGIPQEDIARAIGTSHVTLRKYYRDELDRSETKANSKVAEFLYSAASGVALSKGATHADCLRAAMFWLKTRAGWKETDRHEHSGPDGGPIQTEDATKRDADAFTRAIAGLAARGEDGSAHGNADGGGES